MEKSPTQLQPGDKIHVFGILLTVEATKYIGGYRYLVVVEEGKEGIVVLFNHKFKVDET